MTTAAGLARRMRSCAHFPGPSMDKVRFELERRSAGKVDAKVLIADMRAAAARQGTPYLTMSAYARLGDHAASTISHKFGSWNKALVAAGLDIKYERYVSDERLFENIKQVWLYHGRQPRQTDLSRAPSRFSPKRYYLRFRSLATAMQQFVAWANGGKLVRARARAPTLRMHRTPSIKLRYLVLSRDDFRCRACGDSPALTPGLVLNVDHIVPWSRGGETVESNLQTLCKACNAGKRDMQPLNARPAAPRAQRAGEARKTVS